MTVKTELLTIDNFTPPSRTPWGGTKIRGHFKAAWDLPTSWERVGESWEISVEPSFPSRLAQSGRLLSEAISDDPKAWLGESVAHRFGGQTPLLVKLLDAADNLSVQVHPEHGDPILEPGESGKPEGWLVLDAEPGAGLYLGFKPGIGRAQVQNCIETGGKLDELMNFVEVKVGDAFYIDAGMPHAIGRGVTLLEPQTITPGCRGVTYRFWDWNRRYDANGVLDPAGEPRPLHLERSLDVATYRGKDEVSLADEARFEPIRLPQEEWEFDRHVVIECPTFVTEAWSGSGQRSFQPFGTMLTLTCVRGQARLESERGAVNIRRGQSAVVPAAEGEFTLYLYRGDIVMCRSFA